MVEKRIKKELEILVQKWQKIIGIKANEIIIKR